jgi:hypothetical protein
MTFADLQNGLYNFIGEGLGFAPGSPLQLVQPSPPLPGSTSNDTLWAYMNNIPPFSLTQNYIASAGNEFFSDYQALMSALVPSVTVDILADIGPTAYNAFLTYIQNLTPTPSVTQYPNLFLNWAFAHYPAVAIKGASDWSTMLLDPIARAQMALMPYTSIGGNLAKTPEWSLGYSQLTSQLASAPNKSFSEVDVQSSSNVTNSWTNGGNSGFFGLWGSSESSSSQSQTFASQAVSLSVSFAHVTTFTPAPGAWYDSGALGLAYSTQTGKPWNPGSAITWQKTFGSNGNMQRFASSMIVVSGMNVTAQSTSSFSSSDQTTITKNSGGGLWPFYSSNNSSSFHTSHNFNSANRLTISTSSAAGVPIVIGVTVLSASQYLGHAVAGRANYLQLTAALTAKAAG